MRLARFWAALAVASCAWLLIAIQEHNYSANAGALRAFGGDPQTPSSSVNTGMRLQKRDGTTFDLSSATRASTLGTTGVWSSWAATLRTYMTSVQSPVSSTGSVSWATLQPIVLPVVIVAGIILCFAIFWIITNVTLWIRCCVPGGCCKCCYGCCLFGPRNRRLAFSNKFKSFIVLFVFLFTGVYLTAAIMAALSASQLQTGVTQVDSGIKAATSGAASLIGDVPSLITDVFNNGSLLLNNTIAFAGRLLDVSDMQNDLGPLVNQAVNNLTDADTSIQYLLGNISIAINASSIINSTGEDTNTTVFAANDMINQYQTTAQTSEYASRTFTLDSNHKATLVDATGAISLQVLIDYLTSLNSTLSTPNTPNLTDIAGTVLSQFNSLNNTVQQMYGNSTGNVTGSFSSTIAQARSNVLNSINIASYQQTATSVGSTAADYIQRFITAYEIYYRAAIIALFSVVAFTVFVSFSGSGFGNPTAIKWGLYPFMFLVIFVCLIAAIFLIIAFAGGMVCQVVSSPQTFGTMAASVGPLLGFSIPQSTVNAVFQARQNCSQGMSLLDVIGNTGLVDPNMVNVTYQFSQQIDKLNISSLVSNFNVSNSINFGGNIASMIDNANSMNLTTIDLSNYTSALNGTDPVDSVLTQYVTALNYWLGNLTAGHFAYDNTTSPISDHDFDTWNASVAAQISNIDNARQTYGAMFAVQSVRLNNTMQNIQTTAHSLGYELGNISNVYNNLTSAVTTSANAFVADINTNLVPQTLDFIYAGVKALNAIVQSRTQCRVMAQGIDTAETGVCIWIQGGLDTVWFSSYIIGFFSFASSWFFFQAGHKFNRRLLGGGWFGFGGKCRVAPDERGSNNTQVSEQPAEYDPENKPSGYYGGYGYGYGDAGADGGYGDASQQGDYGKGAYDKEKGNNGYDAPDMQYMGANNIVASNEYQDDYSQMSPASVVPGSDANGRGVSMLSGSTGYYQYDPAVNAAGYAMQQPQQFQAGGMGNPQILRTSYYPDVAGFDANSPIGSPLPVEQGGAWGQDAQSGRSHPASRRASQPGQPFRQEGTLDAPVAFASVTPVADPFAEGALEPPQSVTGEIHEQMSDAALEPAQQSNVDDVFSSATVPHETLLQMQPLEVHAGDVTQLELVPHDAPTHVLEHIGGPATESISGNDVAPSDEPSRSVHSRAPSGFE